MNKFIPCSKQLVDEEDISFVANVLRGDFLTSGPTVKKFEEELAKKSKSNLAIACSSGTAALHLAALVLGLKAGDKVVVPAISFVSTANVVQLVGAQVVFCDVDPDTGLMEPEHLEESILRLGKKPRAVFPVHIGGQVADMRGIHEVAVKHGMKIVEDASHAIGTSFAEARSVSVVGDCRYSDLTAFSFHAIKNVAMGEGGAITTNDPNYASMLRVFRSHGIVRDPALFKNIREAKNEKGESNPWYYEMQQLGYNYRITDIQCALGIRQLQKLELSSTHRAMLVSEYDRLLAGNEYLVKPIKRRLGVNTCWHLYQVLLEFEKLNIDKSEIIEELNVRGIGSQVHYIPINRQPYYKDMYGEINLPGVDEFYRKVLALPLHNSMTVNDVTFIVETFLEILEGRSREF